MTKEMTEGSPLRLIFNFSLPLILGSLLQQTYSLIDAAIVGKYLGINDLAAVGASTSVVFLIIGFCTGCCCGFGIPVAQAFGARSYSDLRRYVANSLWVSLIISIVLAVVTSLLCERILFMMQTPHDILHSAYLYLLVIFIGIPFTFLYNLLSSLIRALGDSKTPFYFLLLSSVLNIVLDLFCILVLHWGVAGAAIATVFSQAVSALLCLYYMFRKFGILKMEKGETALDRHYIKGLLDMGVPMGLQFSITAIGSIMLQSANNALGTSCVAAFTAGMRIKMFFMCPLESMGIAMATFTGQNYGAGRPQRVWMGVKSSMAMVMVYVVAVSTTMLLWSEEMSLMFVSASDTAIIRNTALFLHVSAYMMPLLALLCVLRYTIQGAGFTNFAMLSGVMEMVARGIVSLVFVPDFGYIAVCFGDSVAWFAADIFLVPAFIYVYRRIRRDCTMPQTETAKSF